MCKKIIDILIVSIVFIFISTPTVANANMYTLNDLIENSKLLDKKEIIVQGEAIGEDLNRGDYTWVNINDTTNAIGVYMTTKDSNEITMFGSYKKVGDKIEVKGVFNRVCKEHGGDMDIHSKEVTIIEKGELKNENIPSYKIILAVVLTIITFVSGFYLYKLLNNKN